MSAPVPTPGQRATLYANTKERVPLGTGAYLDLNTARTLGRESAPIRSEEELRELIAERGVTAISFHSTAYPQRPVAVEKAEKWIRKVGRELEGRS